ncbi:MAG: inositol monophosphatase [Candidatus Marinimicrobia bacterium]|nr:inositol monophosphatase [Candidatus Neomarinimicrobiota bacterium]
MLTDSIKEKLFNTALIAAQSSGKYIHEKLNTTLKIDYKGRANMVTQVDRNSEKIITDLIKENFPEHQILAEETTPVNNESLFKWIIDPLDGTTNFIHGFPYFAVSIALEYNDEIIMGVVLDPERNELFSAIKERGAYMNKKPIHVSSIKNLSASFLSTGFPYELNEYFYKNIELFRAFFEKSQDIRRVGSAAIDLCYVACGRFEGFWEFDLNPWDVAAGALIVTEAGGKMSDFSGRDFSIYEKQVLATNSLIEKEMLEVLFI